MLKVVHREQDTSQKLIAHKEVMEVCASVPLTTVTGTSFQQRTKIIIVSKEGDTFGYINSQTTHSGNKDYLVTLWPLHGPEP